MLAKSARGSRPHQAASPSDTAALYDERADRYDGWQTGIRRKRFARIEEPLLSLTNGANQVLEVGCGTGRLLRKTRARSAFGIDVSRGMLRQAGSLRVAAADAHQLPFAEATFDALIAGDGVFRYLDYQRAFAECARVLTPGGRLGIHQYSQRIWSLGANTVNPQHLSHPSELDEPARLAGLRRAKTYLWRSVRIPPYAIRVPAWLDMPVWSHCVVLFERI